MNDLVVLTYGLKFSEEIQDWITIEVTKFDEKTREPLLWAIRKGGSAMSRNTGEFDYEPRPSNRTDEYFEEYRFKTVEEAKEV